MFTTALSRHFAIVLLFAACSARAALPNVTIEFTDRSGVVGPNDAIDVWLTMSIPQGGKALAFDQSLGAPFGFDAADLPSTGQYFDSATNTLGDSTFTSYQTAQTSVFFGCAGTLTSCGSSYYDFSFNFFATPGKPSYYGRTAFDLQPDQTFTYLFGTFTPRSGPVPDGTYNFYDAGAFVVFGGLDAEGRSLTSFLTVGYTCLFGTPLEDCQFTRTVSAVPEPTTWALMGLGLIAVAGRRHRRRQA